MIPAVTRRRNGDVSVGVATLLMDYEGDSVVDRSGNGITISQHDCTIVNEQFKFGSTALKVNGSYLSLNDPKMVVGTQDFTIDMWVYSTDLSGEKFFSDSRDNGSDGCAFIYHTGGAIGFYDGNYIGSDSAGQSGAVLTGNAWHHVEVGRSSGTIYLFLDGELVAQSAAGAYPKEYSSESWVFHAGQYFPIGVETMPGYADEVRVVIGTCVHTTSFTPPTAPY